MDREQLHQSKSLVKGGRGGGGGHYSLCESASFVKLFLHGENPARLLLREGRDAKVCVPPSTVPLTSLTKEVSHV